MPTFPRADRQLLLRLPEAPANLPRPLFTEFNGTLHRGYSRQMRLSDTRILRYCIQEQNRYDAF